MRILSVLAHPGQHSFCRDLVGTLLEVAGEKGHECDLLDLYREQFDPVLSGEDFEAFNRGMTPIDIKEHQDRLTDADIVAFFHPVWWFGMPAVMKGWIDRVFSYGFAYGHDSHGVRPLLTGKKAILVNTTGGAQKQSYEETGIRDAMIKVIDNGIFRFAGFDIIVRRFFFEVPAASDEKKREMRDSLREELWKIL
jgi:NAD(P)H dehydrogenase (quinone)